MEVVQVARCVNGMGLALLKNSIFLFIITTKGCLFSISNFGINDLQERERSK